MELDPQTKDLTAYLKSEALAWAGIEHAATSFGKAAVRSALREEHVTELRLALRVAAALALGLKPEYVHDVMFKQSIEQKMCGFLAEASELINREGKDEHSD